MQVRRYIGQGRLFTLEEHYLKNTSVSVLNTAASALVNNSCWQLQNHTAQNDVSDLIVEWRIAFSCCLLVRQMLAKDSFH